MIANKALTRNLFNKSIKSFSKIQKANVFNRALIGNREWVAFGKSGNASYDDDPFYPFPAIRYKENTNELLALREKEKGDWRKLCMEEKRILYRASFRQTYSEFLAPTGEWKSITGLTLVLLSISLWIFILEKMFVLNPKPKTFSEEFRSQMLRRMIVNMDGHIKGISSKWDYAKDDWK